MVESAVYGVVRLSRGYEIGGNKSGPLVDELVERVLSICARFTPNYWASVVIYLFSLENSLVSFFLIILIKQLN